MCIIIAKEKSGRLPSEIELKNSFEYNADGAGFMYVDNGKVIIDKGYMNYNSFINHYNKLLKKYNNFEGKSLVIHCRIGTHGKNNKGNTHPYTITKSPKTLHTRKIKADIGIAHNGIISNYGNNKLTDTQEFIAEYLYPLYSHYKEFYKNKYIMDGIEDITNSKLAILDKNDELYYVGDFIKDKNLLFSNNSYMSYSYTSNWYKDYTQLDDVIEEEYMLPLEKTWYVDLQGNGYPKIVGNKDYWYDFETMYLYEYKNEEFNLISTRSIIYDEEFEEIYY